jgi:clan AA aspartic protease (TIGR02281 family)
VRWSNIVFIAMVSGAIGWYLHGYLQVRSEPANSPANSPAKLVDPEPVDLREYHTRLPIVEADPVAPGDSQLQLYLRAGNYSDAVAHYNQLLDGATKQQSEIQRLTILEYVNELFRSKSVDSALKLLNLFLESNYKDVAALRLKANILASKKAYKKQIEVLYDAKAYAYLDRDIESIVHEIRISVDKYKQHLVRLQKHADLLNLYQDLVYQEPEYSPYFIELAKAQLTNKLEYDARQSLELVVNDPLVGLQAQQLLAELNDTGEQSEKTIALFDDSRTIPLQRRGNHFVVEATLNNHIRLNLVIDTGASLTIIKPEHLSQGIGSSLVHHPQHLFNTANGLVKAPVLKVDALAIGEFEVANLQIGGLALTDTSGIDGLLGMNFLKHFRFFIDQENNVLRLSLNN